MVMLVRICAVTVTLFASLAAFAEDWRGRLCYPVPGADLPKCEETASRTVSVPEFSEAVPAVWLARDGRTVALLTIERGVREMTLDARPASLRWSLAPAVRTRPAMTVALAARGSKMRWLWPVKLETKVQQFSVAAPAGTYDLHLDGQDVRPISVSNINVPVEGRTDIGELSVRPLFVLTGRVAASGRERSPAAGAEVEVQGKVARSGIDGRYSLRLSSNGPWTVRATHPNYAPAEVTVRDDGDSGTADFELSRGGTVMATVLLPESTANVRARLMTREKQPKLVAELQGEGPEPELVFPRIPAGDYALVFRGKEETEVFVEEAHVEELGEVRLNPTLQPIRLEVTVERNSRPLPNATVHLSNRWVAADIRTDDQGRGTASFWQTGKFALQITAPTLPRPFLTPGELSDTGDVTWSIDVPPTVLTGRLRDRASGQPVPEAELTIASISGQTRVSQSIAADSAGVFSAVLAPGSHVVSVFADGYARTSRTFSTTKDDSAFPLDMALTKLKRVELAVVDSAGQPSANAVVYGDIGNFGQDYGFFQTTDASGKAMLVGDETARLYFIIGPAGSFTTVTISPDTTEAQRAVLPPATGSIRITATTTDSEPLAELGFLISYNGQLLYPVVADALARHVGELRTDAAGRAVLTGLPSGRYGILPYDSIAQRNAFLRQPVFVPELHVDLGSGRADVHLTFGE